MNDLKQLNDEVMAEVLGREQQRVRPQDVESVVSAKLGVSKPTVREAIYDLVENGDLVFAYHDPHHYLEIPAVEAHHAARPMKVITDADGEPWICDAGVDPSSDLEGQGCWRCRDLPFTRDD